MSKVYIVLVNYFGAIDTMECIDSILDSDFEDYRIIIVDNSDDDESICSLKNLLENRYSTFRTLYSSEDKFYSIINPNQVSGMSVESKITVVCSLKNGGFAAGNNIGVSLALRDSCCEYVWLLNNDTTIGTHTLMNLYTFSERTKNIGQLKNGIITSRMNSYYENNSVQGLYGKYNKFLCTSKHIISDKIDDNLIKMVNRKNSTCYPIGACLFLRKAFIVDVGLMSIDYFLYFEELDWVLRARKKGWGFSVCPDTIVYHKEGCSIGAKVKTSDKSLTGDFYSIRNRVLFTRKFYPWLIGFAYCSLFVALFRRLQRRQKARILMVLWIMTHNTVGIVNLKELRFYDFEKK